MVTLANVTTVCYGWCMTEATNDNDDATVLVLRTCQPDMCSSHGFRWPREGLVEAPDWRPTANCGHGLHGLLWGAGDFRLLNPYDDAVWLVVEVAASDIVDLCGKVKFPRGHVVYAGSQQAATDMIAAHPEADAAQVVGLIVERGDGADVKVGDAGQAVVGADGMAIAGAAGTAIAGASSVAIAGDGGTARSGRDGTSMVGDDGLAVTGDGGTAMAGWRGTAIAGEGGMAVVGKDGSAMAGPGGIVACTDAAGHLSVMHTDGTIKEKVAPRPGVAYWLDEAGRFENAEEMG